MMILKPTPITAVTGTGSTTNPASNVLVDSPGVRAAPSTLISVVNYTITITGTINSVCLHSVDVGDGSGSESINSAPALTNVVLHKLDDPYYPTRKTFWWTFDPVTFWSGTIALDMVLITPTPFSAGVLKAGITTTFANPQYPLTEDLVDVTTIIQMTDGSIYRGAEITPSRVFAGTVIDSHANIKSLVSTCRALGGKATIFHLGEDVDDSLFVYGRQGQMPQRVIQAPNISAASINIREWV